jgi:hypothetical protein
VTNRRHIVTAKEAESLAKFIVGLPLPFTVTWAAGGKRSLDQNALMWRWNDEIAKHFGDRTADDVHRENKLLIGCRILVRDDPDFAKFVTNLSRLTYEQKLQAMDYLAVTSIMTTRQLSELMDTVHRKFSQQGVMLTDPTILKYGDGND